ncbi:hypothetical protein CP083_00925 [Candidatus Bathyarchaeota archaeon B24-2]|nr:MAG: hypothetical protein CP083_00925 [Candidatus Bathyarchaeota archaeon B24-2]
MKALILAGGFGTRLRPLSCTRPKILFPIGNRPILDWTIEHLVECGIREIVLAVNYMADIIKCIDMEIQSSERTSYTLRRRGL